MARLIEEHSKCLWFNDNRLVQARLSVKFWLSFSRSVIETSATNSSAIFQAEHLTAAYLSSETSGFHPPIVSDDTNYDYERFMELNPNREGFHIGGQANCLPDLYEPYSGSNGQAEEPQERGPAHMFGPRGFKPR